MEALLALTEGRPELALDAGDVLLHDGDESDRLYVLVTGALMVRKGDEDYIAIDAPGACVGEMSVLLGRPHSATVVATRPSRVRVIDDAHTTLADNPAVLHAVATLLARRLDLVNGYLSDLQEQYAGVDGGLGMVGDVLRSLAAHHGDPVEPGSEREPDPLY